MPLPRQCFDRRPLPTDFEVSTYGQIWMSTEARTILGSDSGSVSIT